jgi:hypothetical protein
VQLKISSSLLYPLSRTLGKAQFRMEGQMGIVGINSLHTLNYMVGEKEIVASLLPSSDS